MSCSSLEAVLTGECKNDADPLRADEIGANTKVR